MHSSVCACGGRIGAEWGSSRVGEPFHGTHLNPRPRLVDARACLRSRTCPRAGSVLAQSLDLACPYAYSNSNTPDHHDSNGQRKRGRRRAHIPTSTPSTPGARQRSAMLATDGAQHQMCDGWDDRSSARANLSSRRRSPHVRRDDRLPRSRALQGVRRRRVGTRSALRSGRLTRRSTPSDCDQHVGSAGRTEPSARSQRAAHTRCPRSR